MLFFQLPVVPEALIRATGRQSLIRTSRPGTFTEEELDRYEESWRQPGCITGMINWYRALMRVPPPAIQDPIVRVPTTVIWGKKDSFLKFVMAEESTRFCPDSRLVYLDEASHWVQHEEPQRVNELLLG
jgi:pimeloyl-ACP methyl ester carboxylesterase